MTESKIGWLILRGATALLLLVHPIARILLGIVDEFGGFLTSVGLPLGPLMAWGITVFELVAAVLLLMGIWIVPVALLFVVELGAGIALVHFQEGWFVVGAGRNGMEYSVLLIACLVALAVANAGPKLPPGSRTLHW